MQFAGHLRGRALLEWNLLDRTEKSSYSAAAEALHAQLDRGERALAAQDFCHTFQRDNEPVWDFIQGLECTFQLAYGWDKISPETRSPLLHSQLQEGLCYQILQTPTVSGAQTYGELCRGGRRCYTCGSVDHLARNCPRGKGESLGRYNGQDRNLPARTNVVQPGHSGPSVATTSSNPQDCLFSSESDEERDVGRIQVNDGGSCPQSVVIEIEGVPVRGLIQMGSDIMIVKGELFKHVAAAARLQKKRFKPPDKSPCMYSNQPFHLGGRMDLQLLFGEKDLVTPVYIKMDAPNSLLLSEGVCHQLNIVCYHQCVQPHRTSAKGLLRQHGTEEEVAMLENTHPIATTQDTQPVDMLVGVPVKESPMTSKTVAMETDLGTKTMQMVRINTSSISHLLPRVTEQLCQSSLEPLMALQLPQHQDVPEEHAQPAETPVSGYGPGAGSESEASQSGKCANLEQTATSVATTGGLEPKGTVPERLEAKTMEEHSQRGRGAPSRDNSHLSPDQSCLMDPARVKLVSSVKVPPHQSAVVEV